VGGLLFLVLGGELLTHGSSKIAITFGIKPIIIGLTVVAFGTSMPEAFVSLLSALSDKNDIAIANVVGSNIFNILFVLGICSIFIPIELDSTLLNLDIPVMMILSLATLPILKSGLSINRFEAVVLLAGYAGYLLFREHRLVRSFGVTKMNEAFFVMNALISMTILISAILDISFQRG